MKTYYRVFSAPCQKDWKEESSYHYIAEFSKYDFVRPFLDILLPDPKYRKYFIVIKEVQTERTDASEGRRVCVVSPIGEYLELDGKPVDF